MHHEQNLIATQSLYLFWVNSDRLSIEDGDANMVLRVHIKNTGLLGYSSRLNTSTTCFSANASARYSPMTFGAGLQAHSISLRFGRQAVMSPNRSCSASSMSLSHSMLMLRLSRDGGRIDARRGLLSSKSAGSPNSTNPETSSFVSAMKSRRLPRARMSCPRSPSN
jgi:hypothetical protein